MRITPEAEEVVFVNEPNVQDFQVGNPPSLVGKWYVSRQGYYMNDDKSSPRTFYLQRGGYWRTRSEDGLFKSEAEARRILDNAKACAVANR